MKIAIFNLEALIDPLTNKTNMPNYNKAMILKSNGTRIVVISDQSAVEAGFKSIHLVMLDMLKASHILRADLLLFCPDKGNNCWEIDPYLPKTGISKNSSSSMMFKLPIPGMILAALTRITNDPDIMTGHRYDGMGFDFKNFNNEAHQIFYCGSDDAPAVALGIRFINTKDFANDKATKGKLG